MSDSREKMSRRELLRGRFLGGLLDAVADRVPGADDAANAQARDARAAGGEGAPAHRQAFPILRPPGAIAEEQFLEQCTRCDACVEACPHDAIVHAPIRFRQAAGTPMIDPAVSPCRMCEDYPCIAACAKAGSSVLRYDLPKKIGIAMIDTQTCLAHQNSFCTVCLEQCPIEGAIEIVHGKPRIVDDKCTGCGVCQHVCPAPANAVILMPLRERPDAPVSHHEEAA